MAEVAYPPSVSTGDSCASRQRCVLVGREREQALLREQLDQMLAGHGGLVLISGEAGIGKTTLVEWLADEAEYEDVLVLWGHAYDLSVTPPYRPWVEIASSYQSADGLPAVPAFLHGGEALAAVGSQEALFARTWDFFATVATKIPVALMLEDLHWADQESLALLRLVARKLSHHPVLLVATYRSEELSRHHPLYQLLPPLVREAGAARLDLRQLDEGALRSLLAARYRLGDADLPRLVGYLRDHADGNPLFARELLRTLEVEGVLREQDGYWSLGDPRRIRMPPLLKQVIEGRLGQLAPETQRLLRIAAVIGQEIPSGIWQAVSGATRDELVRAVEEALEAHLLAEDEDGHRVCFVHALVRQALYAQLVGLRRQAWHRRVAEALSASPQPDPDTVAHHFQQAGDPRAVEWLVRAGNRARQAFAWHAATERYTQALALLPGGVESRAQRTQLVLRLAEVVMGGDQRRALDLFSESARLAVADGDQTLLAYTTFMRGLLSCMVGAYQTGIAEMRDGLAALCTLPTSERTHLADTILDATPRSPDPAALLVMWLAATGHLAEARALGENLLAPGSTSSLLVAPDRLDLGAALYGLAQALASTGQPARAREVFARARMLFLAAGDLVALNRILKQELVWVTLPYETDQLDRRQHQLAEIERTETTADGVRVDRSVPHSTTVQRLFLEGRWAEARRVALAARADVVGGGGKAVPIRTLGLLAHAQGDTALAWKLVREDLREGPATEPGTTVFPTSIVLLRVAATLALDAGDLTSARAWLEMHDRWLDWAGAVLGRAEGALLWARYYLGQGDPPLARRQAERALAHASDPRQPLALIAVRRFLGRLATDELRFTEAGAELQTALALAEACAAPFERALTLLGLAELRGAQGQADRAKELLDEVVAICTPLEAHPTLARAHNLTAQLRAPAPRNQHPGGLTAREVDVLSLIASGRSNREIADTLFLSVRTVERHIGHIYGKIDARGRADATVWAIHHGFVPLAK